MQVCDFEDNWEISGISSNFPLHRQTSRGTKNYHIFFSKPYLMEVYRFGYNGELPLALTNFTQQLPPGKTVLITALSHCGLNFGLQLPGSQTLHGTMA